MSAQEDGEPAFQDAAATATPIREAVIDRKTERNKRVRARYDELMADGKHGHYETMFRVVHEELDRVQATSPTGGEWVVGYGRVDQLGCEEHYAVGLETSPWTPIAVLSRAENVTDRDRANARLIAAAPQLLEAAQAAWFCIGELPPTQARVEVAQMLQTAIEKAAGVQP